MGRHLLIAAIIIIFYSTIESLLSKLPQWIELLLAGSNTDDELCALAAEKAEYDITLNNGNDNLLLVALNNAISNLPNENSAERNEYQLALNDGNDALLMHVNIPNIKELNNADSTKHCEEKNGPFAQTSTKAELNQLKWSNELKARIRHVNYHSPIARTYLEDKFYTFENWPPYMTELFVLNNIQNYSYTMRNKICLFFWGNGSTYDVMSNLSDFYSQPPVLRTREEIHHNTESHRKCVNLFKSYSENLHNANYSRHYYFYNIHQNRMLYIDNRPRHYGVRQEETHLDRLPRWF